MPRPLAPLSLVVILALALAACASSTASDPSAEPVESAAPDAASPSASVAADDGVPEAGTDLTACEILTAADIEAALSLEPGTVDQAESELTPNVLSPGNSGCRYSGDDWGGVIVDLTPEDGANLYDAARGAYDDASDIVIVGTDGAFWSESTGRGFVWNGNVTTMIQIGFLVESGADRAAIAAVLLEDIASKID